MKKTSLFICFVMGICYILLFSYSTSVLYPYYYGGDSAQFMTIGKAWSVGLIPYRDMFDHKGPFIFWVNMIGFIIGNGNKYGVSFVQILFMCVTVCGIFEISQLGKRSNIYGVMTVFCSLVVMKLNNPHGNSVEEYCLPFIVWSTYGLMLWYGGKREEHDWHWSILYGATAGICLMTCVTNIVPICGSVFIICIVLVTKGHFGNLLHNAVSFIGGMFCVIIPFVVYFGVNGLLYEMFYAAVIYNIDYAKGCRPWVLDAGIYDWMRFLGTYAAYYIIFIIAGISFFRKDYVLGWALLITGLLETYLFTSGYAYRQYPLVCLAQVVWLMNESVVFINKGFVFKKWLGILVAIPMAFFMFWLAASNLKSLNTYSEKEWKVLIDEIPSDELSGFVAYGGNEFKEVYLFCDVMPCYKYFAIQEWQSQFSEVVKCDIYSTFENGNAKWILTDGNTKVIDEVLESRYELCDSIGEYRLFKVRDDT